MKLNDEQFKIKLLNNIKQVYKNAKLRDNNMPITDRIGYTVYKKLGIILMD
ncbi:hypothetical protein [Thermohalobacter berrensis]|uniref:hypothetical protein n=1 Tax=Thermohalobacter berrensis TaxID=99594 RepID=UPI001600652B|nr:hypothetical protein [Thermohalobacter berrensis]